MIVDSRITGTGTSPESVNKGAEINNAERWKEHTEKPTFPEHIYKEKQRV